MLDVDTGVDDALAPPPPRNPPRVRAGRGAGAGRVGAGGDRPLRGPARQASHWHGPDGLGGARLPVSGRRAIADGVGYLVERILAEPGEITLVCTAPLTNIATAIQRAPEIVRAVKQVVLMGGVTRPPGNVTPMAEFNIYADPYAAAVVFEQDWPVTMVGLDVTNRVVLTRAERDRLSGSTAPEAALVYEVTRHLFDVRGVDSMALHDPLAVGVAV